VSHWTRAFLARPYLGSSFHVLQPVLEYFLIIREISVTLKIIAVLGKSMQQAEESLVNLMQSSTQGVSVWPTYVIFYSESVACLSILGRLHKN
jgi:hypothetical protein